MTTARTSKKGIPHSVWIRPALFVALLLAGFSLIRFTPVGELLTEEHLVSFLEGLRGTWWAPLLLIGLYALMAPLGLPTGPLLVGGAAFGALYGSIYNMAGLLLGASLAYGVARLLGRDFVVRVTGPRLRRAERIFEHHGFWPLVQTRFMPLPFAVVNFGAALTGVRPALFLIATAVGLVPSTLIHTYFIAQAITTHGRERILTLALYGGAFLLFNVLFSILWLRDWRRRREKYRELLALRTAHGTVDGSGRDPPQGRPSG